MTVKDILVKNLMDCVKSLDKLLKEDKKVVSAKSPHNVFTIKKAQETVAEAKEILKQLA
jgi:hypothetical protein